MVDWHRETREAREANPLLASVDSVDKESVRGKTISDSVDKKDDDKEEE